MSSVDHQVGRVRVMHLVFMLRTGGMELGVVKLVNRLNRSRIASSICSCKPADGVKARLAADVPLFELNRRHGNDPWLVAQLWRLLKRERPHVLHTHAWGTLCEGLIAARLAGVPVVVHGEHGTLDTRRRTVWVQRWAWRRADQVLSVSSLLANRMATAIGFPGARIQTIRNGIDVEKFTRGDRAPTRQVLGISSQELVIGTVGRLAPVKDHGNLLNALSILKRRGARFQALVVGDGALREALEAQAAALGVRHSVRFLGNRDDIDHLLAAFDIFVLPSRSEGLSNTILEAMAAGLPVVATRVGGAEELLEHGISGLLVAPQDPPGLAQALMRLGADVALRQSLGSAGQRRAARDFSMESMAHGYENLYLDLARRHLRLSSSSHGEDRTHHVRIADSSDRDRPPGGTDLWATQRHPPVNPAARAE